MAGCGEPGLGSKMKEGGTKDAGQRVGKRMMCFSRSNVRLGFMILFLLEQLVRVVLSCGGRVSVVHGRRF